ncbi:LysM peptidoglycan-binding domain-containing protein [Deinococcus apachensis]|uniref:LysM peptidoglycan-binding domain-containing protein n=1 Tax=Deinococcus apachensis TaxID=309886 RepID=UPI000367C1CD|nr:LysM peptidoglycan-binding domain-containing protein [Deinococcus apachensis]
MVRRTVQALLALFALGGAAQAGPTVAYTVRAGDTLYSLARRAGTDVQQLIRLNGLPGTAIQPGQVLWLPGSPPARAASAPAVPVRPASPAKTPPAAPLPRPDATRVSGPVIWTTPPAPTVASFIGWFPLTASPIGDALPVRTYLRGLAFDFQTYNNCGPSALSAVLGFYRVKIGQDVIQRTARPGGGYMQISAIAPELAKFGLRTLTIRGGRLSQVKRLLALGIPVIVLQWYDRPGHIPHFRVVRGYDDQAGVFWVSDSMVGPLAYLSYRSFDALWNAQGRQLFPVYPKGYDAAVQQLTRTG